MGREGTDGLEFLVWRRGDDLGESEHEQAENGLWETNELVVAGEAILLKEGSSLLPGRVELVAN